MTNLNIDRGEPTIGERVDDLLKLSSVVNDFMEVQRSTLHRGRLETDGEHTLRLQFIATNYAARFHPELNVGNVSLYGLVHDFVEVYAGDVNSLSATDDELATKALTEKVAFDRLQRELGEAWPWFIGLIHDYEEMKYPEARFVKCFDKVDPSLTHHDNKGEALIRMGIYTRMEFEAMVCRVTNRMEQYSEEFPDVMAIREELSKRVADLAYPTV